MDGIEKLKAQALAEIEAANDLPQLNQIRVQYLGKKGLITQELKQLGQKPVGLRAQAGQIINNIKTALQKAIGTRKIILEAQRLKNSLKQEHIDVTLPGRGMNRGGLHPVTLTLQRITSIFQQVGFKVVEGIEIEDDYHNFEALNIPQNHPARAMHDTFYFPNGQLLRTHTSSVQIRIMEEQIKDAEGAMKKKYELPFRLIAPGRVYRCDSDLTHTPMFNQVEGLIINETATLAELKGLLIDFLNTFFNKKITNEMIRFRPSYFPFTEPSAEVDIMGEQGWLEVLGCGVVHPKVLKNVGIDSRRYTGLAFGIGVERLAMLYYGIDDLRLFFDNDLRFLEQFS